MRMKRGERVSESEHNTHLRTSTIAVKYSINLLALLSKMFRTSQSYFSFLVYRTLPRGSSCESREHSAEGSTRGSNTRSYTCATVNYNKRKRHQALLQQTHAFARRKRNTFLATLKLEQAQLKLYLNLHIILNIIYVTAHFYLTEFLVITIFFLDRQLSFIHSYKCSKKIQDEDISSNETSGDYNTIGGYVLYICTYVYRHCAKFGHFATNRLLNK